MTDAHTQPTNRPRMPGVLIAHPGTEMYGSDRVMLETASALVDRGWRVSAAVPDSGALARRLSHSGVRVAEVPTAVLRKSALRPLGMARFVVSVLRSVIPSIRLVRSCRPDVVYVSTITVPSWVILSRILGVPVVVHVQEAEVSVPRLLRKLMNLPQLMASRVVVNSEFTLDVLADLFPRVRRAAVVVANPVPGPPSPLVSRTSIRPELRVLYLGRLSPRKGPQFLVPAIAEVRRRGGEVRLRMVGSVFPGYEWFAEELRSSVKALGLEDRIETKGFQPDPWPDIDWADVLVVPSVEPESFGNTAIEALLASRPVVVTSEGGLPEAVQGMVSAQIVPPGDPGAIARSLSEVAEHWSRWRRAGEIDASVAERRHSPVRYGDRVDALLRSCTTALLEAAP